MRAYAFILLAALACAPPKVSTVDPRGGSAGDSGGPGEHRGMGGSGGTSSGGARDAGFGFVVADASTTTSAVGDAAGPACAQAKVGAQQVPVDLLVLLDNSGSMNAAAGMRTKWATAQEALVTFVKDPASAGLGVGLAFFPHSPELQACNAGADCPSGDCRDHAVCLGVGGFSGYSCFPATANNRCPLGGTCTPQGVCSMSKLECRNLDAPCPSGADGDVCVRADKVCESDGEDSCEVSQYQKPSVPIAPLPGNEAKLVTVINGRTTSGGTPTGVALRGAFEHLRTHLQANPGRRGAVILTTDGLPSGTCMPTDPPSIAGDIRLAQMGTPPIDTYVIGVFTRTEAMQARPALEMFAAAGGTGMPFLLDSTADLGQRLNEALARIRGQALPCEFVIPPGNGAIDFGKVNVTLQSNGQEQTVPYVEGMDRCDPARGGWYYDVVPAAGTPTRILACPATCQKFKAEREPKVSLVFGCETVVVK
jgi:hypothetical protein